MDSKVKGRTTIRIAAVLFILSALLELLSVNAEAPLFGGIRSGTVALVYHMTYVMAYLAAGLGLWWARKWGYWAVMAATALYTLDKVQFLLARETMISYIMQALSGLPELTQAVPKEQLYGVLIMIYLTLIACWWGFAFYIHLRRGYFSRTADQPL